MSILAIDPCPALHIISDAAVTVTYHRYGPDGRCRHCHTTTTTKGDTA